MPGTKHLNPLLTMEKNKNVPKLRFPEFSGEWEEKKLGEIATFSKGKGVSKADITEDGKTECIRYGELYTRYNEVIDKVYSKTNIDKANLVLSEANDVIIPASGETQIDISTASCVIKSGIALGGDLNVIKTPNNGVFLSYYLNSKKKIDIASLAQGISVVHLYSSQLALLNLNLPSCPEQTQIASFLTAVDEKLTQLKKKKTLLEQYKKGIMQKLFTQELRFKDNNNQDFPDWQEKTLGEVCDIKGGKRIPKGYLLQSENNGYPYITISDMKEGTVLLENIQFVPIDVIDQIKNYTISTSDIYISVAGTLGLVGIIPKELENANLTENANKLTKLKCDQTFLYQFLTGDHLKKLIENVKTIGAQPKLAIYALNDFNLSLPSLPEQQKIATFLSSIDEKISHSSAQIEKMEAWKKGLLQQMFV